VNKNISLNLLVIVMFPSLLCSLGQRQSDEVNGRCVSASCRDARETGVDRELKRILRESGFTGNVESTLEHRLGRRLDPRLADLGRLLWFDVAGGLHSDKTCGRCHSPTNGMGVTQSVAIGIQNNGVVGMHRTGPRNQRRTPAAANAAFYPRLMWNGRFSSNSGDPFDNSLGFHFPPPEDDTRFPANDPGVTHLLIAQAHIPPTELVEVAGFTGTAGTIGPRFDAFDDGLGGIVPAPDASGSRNEPIRQAVLDRLNKSADWRAHFGQIFSEVAAGGPIDFTMFGRAISEFEFMLTFANAPVDQFARGDLNAMTLSQKKGAEVFFGKARCVACHAVRGQSNEMFSDFKMHVAGVPQIAPFFGVGQGNVIFDGPDETEDFGLEQISGDLADRYKFRTSPLRNVALQAAFFHNGSFTRLEDAIRFHLDAFVYARDYDTKTARVSPDLSQRIGPVGPVLDRLDPLLLNPPDLSADEFSDLVEFVRSGLLDPRASKHHLCQLVPKSVPSGLPTMKFEGCSTVARTGLH
jgi:cytochrome c peroxidase